MNKQEKSYKELVTNYKKEIKGYHSFKTMDLMLHELLEKKEYKNFLAFSIACTNNKDFRSQLKNEKEFCINDLSIVDNLNSVGFDYNLDEIWIELNQKTGVVISQLSGNVLSVINTTEKAGIYQFASNTSGNHLVNAFKARLSFSKVAFDKVYKIGMDKLPTIYHYNYNTLKLEK